MSPLNKQQLDQIREERREQIKQAALKIFARHGYAGTKTSVIAAEAGISEGLIFRYFKSKDELFTALVQELLEEARKETGNAQLLPGSPVEQIKAFTEDMLDENNKFAFMFMLRARKEGIIPEEAARILEQNPVDSLLKHLLPVFINGQKSGQFSAGDPLKLLSWYIYMVNSLIVEEVEQEEHGMPSADFLMRVLMK
ncbi:TetR/AcrR family transcriptional regulator [Paenibacillus sp. sptzw28]|uniref:TetR/AcrR family transcriptional regulator n=1 Tax=Paenibacillus sp. sptzw28 TaxID=715179 RepID=UPI001C6F05E2|nr:TetR/AcrR family transcriptional regulator [Paenibacillus sp. sptzw28]QYR22483.1 TetR/AcrR family transcriptional regulator [Paenibacillus sp. sptzw28]